MRNHLPLKILSVILATVFMILLLFYAVGAVIVYGPSPTARDEFAASLAEDPSTSFIINLYPGLSNSVGTGENP